MTFSLRTLLITGLLVFSVLPAATVGMFLYRSNLSSAQALSEKHIEDTALRAATAAQAHLAQAHAVLNGLSRAQPDEAGLARARQVVLKPELFEQMAFVMTAMAPELSMVSLGTDKGEFLGVETLFRDSGALVRVTERKLDEASRRRFLAEYPGDRRQAPTPEDGTPDARLTPWYQAAVQARGRTFTPVRVSDEKQLMMTLAQPVDGADHAAIGVVAVDLPLEQLGERLRGLQVSPHGTVFLMDDNGFLLATSTGDALFSGAGTDAHRLQPEQSLNALIRGAAAAAAEPDLEKPLEASASRVPFLRRVPLADDTLLVAFQPVGDSSGLRWSLVVAAPQSDFGAMAPAGLKKTLAAAALMVALGALLALGLAWRLTHHFKRLNEDAAQLPLAGAMPRQPIPPPGSHIAEVHQLARTLQNSARDLQRQRSIADAHAQALEEAGKILQEQVDDLAAELGAAREDVSGSTRAKAAFLAAMSHEIRTPLNGVVGMTTLLADTALDAEQRDYVHTMLISSDQLLAVINDILDFSKIESGRLDLENEPLNLIATIEEACDIGAPRARDKGLELLVDMNDDLPGWVYGDVTRLRQVLLNLVNNAVKFTERGQVIVSAQLLEDFSPNHGALVEFRVKDTGIGIAYDQQAALFQSFVQVDTSTTRKYAGSGLGLAICKRLVKLMGGRVGLESAPGEGSTFWFTARLGHAKAPEVAMLSSLHLASLAGKRVAVVDDTLVNLRILDKQLRRWGMDPTLFERAADALAWLAQHPVDVIVTDMHMPEMDGLGFARRLRERMPDIPIMLLTSGTMPSGAQASVFDARLLKPYRQSQLFESLARITSAPPATKNIAKSQISAQPAEFILVADDNAINLKVALAMLAKLGYEAATAINGSEAVDRVAASMRTGTGATPREGPRQYAAILMDVNMPVMDGFAAARLILSNHGAAAPPIIALTASVLEEDRQRCRAAGMVGFLPKPLRIDELAEALALYARPPELDNAAKIIIDSPAGKKGGGKKSPEPAQVLMDWSRLEQFREFDDEELSMTHEVVTLFTKEMPQRIDDIRAGLSASDSAVLSRAAHALKGAASNVGAQALSGACSTLEQSCLQGQWPADAGAQVKSVIGFADRTCEALQEWAARTA